MNDRFAKWVQAMHRKPLATLLGTVICALTAGVCCLHVRFDPSLTCFFPPKSGVARTLAFLNDAALADKVAVSFERTADSTDDAAFFTYTDAFAARAASAPGIRGVLATVDAADYQRELARFLELAPQCLTRKQLEAQEDRLSEHGVQSALRHRYQQSARPEGSFLTTVIQHDPLGIFNAQLAAFGSGAMRWGYDISIVGGRLMSRDGRHRLIVLDTDVPIAHVSRSEQLLETLNSLLADPPRGVRADVICGHIHSVSNQTVIRHDLLQAGTLSSIVFIVLLFVYYRNWRMVMILLVPVFAVLVALPACAAFFGRMTFLVAAFGPIIVGLTNDYSIHTYMAARRGEKNLRALLPPIWAGMFTTLVVFLAFFASRAEGYHQLAGFGSLSILAAFFFAVGVLPHLVGAVCSSDTGTDGVRPPDGTPAQSIPTTSARGRLLKSLAILLMIVAVAGLPRLRFDTDFAHLDGARQSVWDAEKHFQDIWGQGESGQALAAVKVADGSAAEAAGADLYDEVSRRIGRDAANGFSALVPPPRQRAANLAGWHAFWSQDGRADTLRDRLAAQGAAFGFSDAAFAPFLKLVASPPGDTTSAAFGAWLRTLRDRYIRASKSGGAYAVVYFPDRADLLAKLKSWLASRPDVVCVSKRALSGEIGQMFSADLSRVLVLAFVLLFAAAWAVLRSLRHVAVALLPVAVAEGVLFGIMGLLNVRINIVHLMAGIVVLGVTFDYGVFALHIFLGRLGPQTWRDMRLCLLTTLAGSAPFLLSRHPVLFSLGVVLTGGVLAGYAAAVLFARPACRRLGICTVLIGVCLTGGGCVGPRIAGTPFHPAPCDVGHLHTFSTNTFTVVHSVSFDIHGRGLSGLGVTRVEPAAEAFDASCLTAQGMTLFALSWRGNALTSCRVMPELAKLGDVGGTVAQDIRHVYFGNRPAADARWLADGSTWTACSPCPDGTLVHRFDAATGRLLEKFRLGRRNACEWNVTYAGYNAWGPQRIVLKNRRFRYAYTLSMRIKSWEAGEKK